MEEPQQEGRSLQHQEHQDQDRQHCMSRALSVSSRAAVNTVEQLKARFAELEESLRKTTKVVVSQGSQLEDLLQAKLELAQIIGTLEKFQFNEIDAVVTHGLSSGKGEVRQQRKDLTRAVSELSEEATARHREVAELIAVLSPSPASGGNDAGGGR